MRNLTVLFRSVLFLAVLAVAGAPAHAQISEGVPSREEIESRLEGLAETDAAAAKAYREAIAQLDRKALADGRAEASLESVRNAEARLAMIRSELERTGEVLELEVPAGAALAELEQLSSRATADLRRARDEVNELQGVAALREQRRTEIPEAIAAAQQQKSEIEIPAVPASGDDRTPIADARAARTLAELAAIDSEIAALEAELAEYNALREVLPARRDLAAWRVTQAEAAVAAWQSEVGTRRQLDAEKKAQEAERLALEAARSHPVLQAFAAESGALATARTQEDSTPRKIAAAQEEASAARAALDEIRSQYLAVRRRIEVVGLTRSTGLLLQRHYSSLEDGITEPRSLRRRVKEIAEELESADYARIEADEARLEAGRVKAVVAGLVAAAEAEGLQGEDPETLAAVALELAEARRDLTGTLEADAVDYAGTLFELNSEMSLLLEAVLAYESYIRERTLWVRSIGIGKGGGLPELRSAVGGFTSPVQWKEVVSRTGEEASLRWPLLTLSGAGVLLLFASGRWAKRRLGVIGGLVGRYRTDSFRFTLEAAALTAMIALPGGVLMALIGFFVAAVPDQENLGIALGAGLIASAKMLVVLSVVRGVFARGGLADAHFRWSSGFVGEARGIAIWFIPLVVLAVGVLTMADSIETDFAERTVGRLAFIVMRLGVAGALLLIFRPQGPLSEFVARRGGWLKQLRMLWMTGLVCLPLLLVVLSWLGYFFTARQIGDRMESTIALGGILLLVNAMLMRWLFVAGRRVAVEDARRRREQAIADRESGLATGASAPTDTAPVAVDEDKLDLPAISQQTQKLFRVGLVVAAVLGCSAIWAEILPALRMLERVEIYPEFRVVASLEIDVVPELENAQPGVEGDAIEASPGDTGGDQGSGLRESPGAIDVIPGMAAPLPGPVTGEPVDEGVVTLADLGLSLILLVATLAAFRNLPGLAEIVVLQRLPLDAGSRYALSTVLRYLIAVIGIAWAFSAVDIGWSKVQWLAAAFTFGLAFGLQEIFANFVSGLIILAERPIRIGDTVTVGTVTGTVSRIRMRATTITDWDLKELVIPNKNFITGDIINWTLSDPLLRVSIPVGVAYGADVRLAERVLKQVADATPHVVAEPKATVYFKQFGDSTLNFDLRVFIPHVDYFVQVRHDLHMRITEAFRREGIEIAFPQRDLHVRSFEGLERLVKPASGGATTPE